MRPKAAFTPDTCSPDTSCIPCRRLHVSCISDKIVVDPALRRQVSTCIRIQVARPGYTCIRLHVSGVNAALWVPFYSCLFSCWIQLLCKLTGGDFDAGYDQYYGTVRPQHAERRLHGQVHSVGGARSFRSDRVLFDGRSSNWSLHQRRRGDA